MCKIIHVCTAIVPHHGYCQCSCCHWTLPSAVSIGSARWHWCSAVFPALCLRHHHKEVMPEAQLSNPSEQQHTQTFVYIKTTAGHCRTTGATFQRWKTEHDTKADVEVIVGILSHSAIVLFNKTFLRWHIVGPQQSCGLLQDGPQASGATCGSLIHHPSTANTSWQKMMTHFLQIFTFLPLCRPWIAW